MKFCLTNAGKEYIARLNAGEIQMHLSRAVTGSGISSSLEILSGVVDERQQIQLDDVRSEGEYTLITCVLTNLELDREYVLRQLGLYAIDETGEERLVIIGQDIYGDRIPIPAEKEVEYVYNIGMRVSNAAEVIFDFSINDFLRKKYFYEHLEEFEKYRKAIQEQFEALPRVRVGPAELLDRKDTILFETLQNTNNVSKIRKRDHEDTLHEYALAAEFGTAGRREELQSGETLAVLFGKIKRYFADMKYHCFAEADDPFVLMTEATYKPPAKRTEGSLYGLVTKIRGLIVIQFDRYVQGLEEPRVERTLYGVETSARADAEASPYSYAGIMKCIVFLEGDEVNTAAREPEKLYAIVKEKR